MAKPLIVRSSGSALEKVAGRKFICVPFKGGGDVDDRMLRDIFLPPEVTPDQVAFCIDRFHKVRATPASFMRYRVAKRLSRIRAGLIVVLSAVGRRERVPQSPWPISRRPPRSARVAASSDAHA
jgi:hypothetical protein